LDFAAEIIARQTITETMQRQRSFGTARPRSPYCDIIAPLEKVGSLLQPAGGLVETTNVVIGMNNTGIALLEASNFEGAVTLFRRALSQLQKPAATDSGGAGTVFVAASTSDDDVCSHDDLAKMPMDQSSSSKPVYAQAALQQQRQQQQQQQQPQQLKEYYIYQRREYDEGMNMYYSPVRMDASTMDAAVDPLATATSILYYNLGQAYLGQDLDEDAQEAFERSLDSQRTGYIIHQPAVAPFKLLHNLGYIQYRQQNIQAAMQTFCDALQQSQLSINKLDVANSLNCLGVLYFHLPEPNVVRSMDCYMRALAIRKEILGPNHIDVATLHNNIGRVHYIEQHYDAALIVYEEALRIRRALLGHDHLDVAGKH
jgi:tetratricopeptide (TPR) repeat protein